MSCVVHLFGWDDVDVTELVLIMCDMIHDGSKASRSEQSQLAGDASVRSRKAGIRVGTQVCEVGTLSVDSAGSV